MEIKTKYNQEKVEKFLDNTNLKYFFDKSTLSSFILDENNYPISYISFSGNEKEKLYHVDSSYSQSGLGKILYYLTLMDITNDGGKLTHSEDGSVRGNAFDIWLSINNDESVGYVMRKNYEPIDENDVADRYFFKAPDSFYEQVKSNKNIDPEFENRAYFKKSILKMAGEIFSAVYEFDSNEMLNNASENKTAVYINKFINEGLSLYLGNKNNLYVIDKNRLPIAGLGGEDQFGDKEYINILKDIIADEESPLYGFCLDGGERKELKELYDINEFSDSVWNVSEDEFLDKKIALVRKIGISPTLKPINFESDDSELNITEETKSDYMMRFYLKMIERINDYYKDNPVMFVNGGDELKRLLLSGEINLNPEINIIFYDNEDIKDSFDLEPEVNGFFAIHDGEGIRIGGSNTFINENLEAYVEIKKDMNLEISAQINDFNYDEIIASYANTLTHELKHIEDFISLSGGNTPLSAESLCDNQIIEHMLGDLVYGADIFEKELSPNVDWDDIMEERVETDGYFMYLDLKMKKEPEYKEFLNVMNKLNRGFKQLLK